MRYQAEITIPAATPADAPELLTVSLCYGVITEVEVFFPAGHSGMTYLQVWRFEHQLLPTTPGLTFRGDDTHITMTERIQIHEWPLSVELRGWAPSTQYDHLIMVGFTVEAETPRYSILPIMVGLPEGME